MLASVRLGGLPYDLDSSASGSTAAARSAPTATSDVVGGTTADFSAYPYFVGVGVASSATRLTAVAA